MQFILCITLLLSGVSTINCVYTHRDPALLKRLPKQLKDSIDNLIAKKLEQITSLHFDSESSESVFGLPQFNYSTDNEQIHGRVRRQLNITSTSAAVSEWSEFDDCTTRCGGGYQVRTRVCISGNCTAEIGPLTETRICGTLPCVPGTYVLDSISSIGNINVTNSKSIKFFKIGDMYFCGYITDTSVHILHFDQLDGVYKFYQNISCEQGISFDVMNTHRRFFLVVLEKAETIFQTRTSRLYSFSAFTMFFELDNPVRFEVWEPKDVKTFDVFGLPFIAVINSFGQIDINMWASDRALICDQESKVFTCPDDTVLSIIDVFYGRTASWECPEPATDFDPFGGSNVYCSVPGIKPIVARNCDGKKTCTVSALSYLYDYVAYSANCVLEKKYLKISYQCLRVTYMSKPMFYKWDGIGLSVVSGENLITYGATDIEPFSIHNQQYVAVANFQDDQKNHHLDSEIYVYSVLSGRFSSLQKIRTDGAVDFEFFTVGNGIAKEYFLVVANHVKILPSGDKVYLLDSVIYKWNWNIFVPFQCIKTNGAKKWTAVSGNDGQFLLSVVNQYGNVTFYGYNGWRFNPTKVQPEGKIFDNVESIIAFMERGEPMFLVKGERNNVSEDTKNSYQVNFMKTFPKYELFENTVQIIQELNRTVYDVLVPQVQTFNVSYNEKQDVIVFVDQDVNVTSTKTFKTIHVLNDTTVDSATVKFVNLSPFDANYKQMQTDVQQALLSINTSMETANMVLSNAVTKSTEQVILGNKTFYKNVSIDQLTANENVLVDGMVNKVDLSDLSANALLTDENATITGSILFKDITVQKNLDVHGRMNNISIDQIVFLDTNDTIYGTKTFQQIDFISESVTDIRVEKSINGKTTSKMLLKHEPQNITGAYTFQGRVVFKDDVHVESTVNSYDISTLANDAILINKGDVNITSQKTFKKIALKKNLDMRDFALINNVDVSELTGKGVHLNAVSQINKTVVFSSNVSFMSPLNVAGSINGVPVSDMLFTSSPADITGRKVFSTDVYSSSTIEVDGKINGVNLSGDVLLTFGNQTVNSVKYFNSNTTFMSNNLISKGLIDQVDTNRAFNDSLLFHTDQQFTGYKVINHFNVSEVTIENCHPDCQFFDVLTALQQSTVRNTSDEVVLTGLKSFANDLQVYQDINVDGYINGETVPGKFLLQNKTQVITGTHVFTQRIIFDKNVEIASINDLDIDEFYKKVVKISGNIVFNESVTFRDDTYFMKNLIVNGTVDGKTVPEDFVLSYQNETIYGVKTFQNTATVEKLFVDTMTTFSLIDGVNVTFLNQELLKHNTDQIVKGTKRFTSHVSFAGNWTIPGLIDGVNITELAANAMRINKDQTVTGIKTFTSAVSVTNKMTAGGLIDGVNLTDFMANAIYTNRSNQYISGDLNFGNVRVNGDITISNLFNNENFSSVVEDTLMRSGDQIITGFYDVKHHEVAQNVEATGKMNNISIATEIVSIENATLITGVKKFENVLVLKNANVKEINGINFTELNARALYIDKDSTLFGLYSVQNDMKVLGNLTVNGLVNGYNLTDLFNSTLMKTGDQVLTTPIYFDDVVFLKNVSNGNLFNQLNLTSFEQSIVYKCYGPNRPLNSNITFNQVNVSTNVQSNNLNVTSKINGVDFNEFVNEIVTDQGNHSINGRKIFKHLQVQKVNVTQLNGVLFPLGYVTIHGNETITGVKTFLNDTVFHGDFDIAENKTINGIDLSEHVKVIVFKNGTRSKVTTPVEFLNLFEISKDLNVNAINSVKINNELLLRDTNQSVTGSKVMSNSVETMKEVNTQNDINGIDLDKLQNELVLSGTVNTIGGLKKVVGNIIIQGNLETNLVDDSNVTTLFSGFNKISNLVDRSLVHFNDSLSTHSTMIKQMTNSVFDIHQQIHYFVKYQDILLPYQSISMDVLTMNATSTMLIAGAYRSSDGFPCTNTSVYIQTNHNGMFNSSSQFVSNSISDTSLTYVNDSIVLMTSSSKLNRGCLASLDDDNQYSTVYKSYDSLTFQRTTAIKSFNAKHVDVIKTNNTLIGLLTNTFDSPNQTPCTDQLLFSFSRNKTNILSSVNSCVVVKSIILANQGDVTTLAVLAISDDFHYAVILDVSQTTNTTRQIISTYYASDIIHFEDDGDKYLVIVNTYDTSLEALAVSYTVPVTVMKLNEHGIYTDYQNIDVTGATLAKQFKFGVYSYLAFATLNQQITIFVHKGINKWQEKLSIPTQGYGSVKDMQFWVSSKNELYFSVLLDDSMNENFPSKIKILKAEMNTLVDGDDVSSGINSKIVL